MKGGERSLALAAASRAGPGVRTGAAFTPSEKFPDLRFPIASVHRSGLIHPYAVIPVFPVFPFIPTITSYPSSSSRPCEATINHPHPTLEEKREEIPWHEDAMIKTTGIPPAF